MYSSFFFFFWIWGPGSLLLNGSENWSHPIHNRFLSQFFFKGEYVYGAFQKWTIWPKVSTFNVILLYFIGYEIKWRLDKKMMKTGLIFQYQNDQKKKQKQNKKIILLLLLMSTVRKYELHWIFSEMADGRDVIKRRDTLFF